MSLTREQILAIKDRKTVEVQVPPWDGAVFVRTLSGQERDELESAIRDASKAGDIMRDARARFACAFASDEEGTPIFTLADVDSMTGKSAAALDLIVNAGMALNAMREKDAEELQKN